MPTIARLGVLVALGLAGCASESSLYLADGSVGRRIDCSGGVLTWDACYERAGALCQSAGYAVVARNEDRTSGPLNNIVTRSLVIKCNKVA